jgi:Domain of unknown function (DUF6398)
MTVGSLGRTGGGICARHRLLLAVLGQNLAVADLDELKIPKAVRPVAEEVITITDAVCAKLLDAEYAVLARQVVAKLARKRPSPLLSGRRTTWVTPEFMRADVADDNPAVWFVEVDGLVMDARSLSLDFQTTAFARGYIPYIPALGRDGTDALMDQARRGGLFS